MKKFDYIVIQAPAESRLCRTDYINSDAVSPMNMQLAFGDFIKGAQWADKTMLERVEQWLIKNNRGHTIGSLHRFLEEE